MIREDVSELDFHKTLRFWQFYGFTSVQQHRRHAGWWGLMGAGKTLCLWVMSFHFLRRKQKQKQKTATRNMSITNMWLSAPSFHKEEENQENAYLCLGYGERSSSWDVQASCRQPRFSYLFNRRVTISARNKISLGTWRVGRGHEQGADRSEVPEPASMAPENSC